MNQRKMGTILSYVHILVTNTISLIYTPYMLRMMGKSEYGLYGTANSFISYLSLLSFGIVGAYVKFNAKCRINGDRDEEKRLNGMFLTIFSILALLVLIGGLFLIVFAEKLVENTFTDGELMKLRILMLILTLSMAMSFVFNVVLMALQAYEKFIIIRVVLLLAGIITPIVNVVILQNGGRAIEITAASFIVSMVSYLIFYIYARKYIQLRFSFHGFSKEVLREIFVFSSFLFLNSITDQLTFSTDNMILSAVKGTGAVAVYSVGANFRAYFQNFSTAISSVFSAQVNLIVAKQEDMKALDDLFVKIGRIQFYVVSLIMLGYMSIGYDFINMWAGKDYKDAFWIGLLLMISVFVPAIQNVGLEIQKAMNMHKARTVVYFIIALVNIILTIPFSILWEGIGAALATTICMFFGTVVFMNYYYARHIHLNIKKFWGSIGSIVKGYVFPIVMCVVINKYWEINTYSEFFGAVIIICIVFFISIWKCSMNEYEKNLIKFPIQKLLKK